jgi:hypothetical protein
MKSSPLGLSSTASPQNPEYLKGSVLLAAFSAANLALEHDLTDIRNLENTEQSAAMGTSRRAGGGDGEDDDADDCNSIAAELEYLASSQAQENIREELSEAEDCWRQSLSSLVGTEKDQDLQRDVSEIEREDAPNDDSEKPLDDDNECEVIVIGCDNVDQIQPKMVVGLGPFKRRVVFRRNSDDETLSTEEGSLQLTNSVISDMTESCSGAEMAETSETRKSGPLTIDTQIPSRGSTATDELIFPESPMGAIMSSALLHKGHAGMSLALASDILASQIYSQQSLLPYWLNKQLADRCESEKLSPTKTHWLLGVPLIGSASKDGRVWLMGVDSDLDTPTLEDETLDDIEAL